MMNETEKHVEWMRGFAVGGGELTEKSVLHCHDAADHMEKLQQELDVADEKLHRISSWANAYPDTVFIEPTKENLAAATELLGEERMTALHGSWGRHIIEGVRNIITPTVLEAPEDG